MQGADSLYVGQSSGSENRATGRFGFSAVGDFDMDFDEEDFQRDNPESRDVDSYLDEPFNNEPTRSFGDQDLSRREFNFNTIRPTAITSRPRIMPSPIDV
jgi:hypothetical protein